MHGPEVMNLMLGTWAIKSEYAPSKEMPNGDTGEGIEVWRPGPGGYSVIEEFHEKNVVEKLVVSVRDGGMRTCKVGDSSGAKARIREAASFQKT